MARPVPPHSTARSQRFPLPRERLPALHCRHCPYKGVIICTSVICAGRTRGAWRCRVGPASPTAGTSTMTSTAVPARRGLRPLTTHRRPAGNRKDLRSFSHTVLDTTRIDLVIRVGSVRACTRRGDDVRYCSGTACKASRCAVSSRGTVARRWRTEGEAPRRRHRETERDVDPAANGDDCGQA